MSAIADTARAGELSAVVTGIRLPFCVMNEAGFATNTSDIRALARSRSGAVVLMPMTVHPFVHPGFRALNNPGFDKMLPLVRDLVATDRPVVASVVGATIDELGVLAKAFAGAGCAAIEVDLGDPWLTATLAPFESVETFAAVAARVAAEASPRPVWVKLPERVPASYAEIVPILINAGVRAIVSTADFQGFEKLLLEAPRSLDVIVRGQFPTGYDVSRTIAKGVRAVQLAASMRNEGVGVFGRLEREMRKATERPGTGA